MKTLKTLSGRILKISSNKSARTYTIKTDAATFRTFRMSKEEFNSCLYNTGQDWQHFLNSDDYYKVK
jgi:hypothetical protein